ncbi:hypothetical protein PV721_28070 [Streptomyces sp. MB09-01]|uniref:hypothetical protein n=1 Tax=Streptomyces sp. MB09-01 TaxID=3028666 RepID=UPI0029B5BAC4|nr:hypothetical protein [Streptomyces sp. MB09-01]MDX3538135.1 hypothetical protein [Streptomyces sp. MB09-01]
MCACGWRSAAQYPLDWAAIGDRPLYEADVDLAGPLADWTAHLSVVRDTAVPLPEQLAALLVEMAEQLTATAADAPLAALRAAGVLERIAARVGREAAGALCDDGMSTEAVAAAQVDLGGASTMAPARPGPRARVGRDASFVRPRPWRGMGGSAGCWP